MNTVQEEELGVAQEYVGQESAPGFEEYANAMMKKYDKPTKAYEAYTEAKKKLLAISFPGRCILAVLLGFFISTWLAAFYLFDIIELAKLGFYIIMLVLIYLAARALYIF